MKIAFIGLGNMGGSMAQNLLKAGQTVLGYDLSEKALQQFAESGGIVCDSPQAAAEQADVVISMLPAAKHVREVYLGETGILAVMRAGSLCIDSSTIDPQTIKDVAAEGLKHQVQVCDAPVSGGTIGAKAGTLTFMVGADEATYEQVKPILSFMGKNTVHSGAVGAGQIAKICNNMILGISMAAVAEGMALGSRLGIDSHALAGVINSSSGRCWSSEICNPWPDISPNAPAGRGYTDGFASQLMLKDLGLAIEAASQVKQPVLLGGLHASDTCQIALTDVRVHKSMLLGKEGEGLKIALSNLEGGRIGIAAQAVGLARAALEEATRYAKERVAFGKPIFEQQAVSFRLASMATEIAAARQLVHQAARLKEAGQPCLTETSMAKLFASEMTERVCSNALQIFGGYGYLKDFPIERIYRDARICQIYEGTSDIQRLVIARSL